jgi:DNA-binding NtrC family response regulator
MNSWLTHKKLLVVEDDHFESENISKILHEIGAAFTLVGTTEEALLRLSEEAFDILLTDLHIGTKAGLDQPDGFKVIHHAVENQPNLIIIACSSDPRNDICQEVLRIGAQHFLRKPITSSEDLIIAINLGRERKTLLSNQGKLSRKSARVYSHLLEEYSDGLVIDKLDAQRAQGLAKRTNIPAILIGETGTGKEEFAKLVHRIRMKNEGPIPFVAVNCAAINENLAESILFGHKKGSFTGADTTTIGYIGEADGGILFLDEIHCLNLGIQKKLLRVFNDGTFNRLGEQRTYVSKFQIICASTVDLDDEVEQGRFLLDLRARVSGIDIYLRPLRERLDIIPALTGLFLLKKNIFLEENVFQNLCQRLSEFYWRSNIRQLYKVLDSWIIRCEIEELPLLPEHLPILKGMVDPRKNAKVSTDESQGHKLPAEQQEVWELLNDGGSFEQRVERFERYVLKQAILNHRTITEVARALEMNRSTLDAKRKKYSLF